MRKTSVVLTVLVACFVIVETSIAADDSPTKKEPAKSKWVQTMDKDGDKKLTVEELKAAQQKQQPKKPAKKKFQPERLKAAEKK